MTPGDLDRRGCLGHMRKDSRQQAIGLYLGHVVLDGQLFWIETADLRDTTLWLCQIVHTYAVARDAR